MFKTIKTLIIYSMIILSIYFTAVYLYKLNIIYYFQKKHENNIRYNLQEYIVIYKFIHKDKQHTSLFDSIWFNKYIKRTSYFV